MNENTYYAISLNNYELICTGSSEETILNKISKAQIDYPESASKYLSNGYDIVQAASVKAAKTLMQNKLHTEIQEEAI